MTGIKKLIKIFIKLVLFNEFLGIRIILVRNSDNPMIKRIYIPTCFVPTKAIAIKHLNNIILKLQDFL